MASKHLTRRRFVQAAGMASTTSWLMDSAWAASTNLEGYASATSVKQGGKITFYARDPQGQSLSLLSKKFVLAVARVGLADQTLLTTNVSLYNCSVPSNASAAGCGWPTAYTLSVPANWPSGIYYAAIGSGNRLCCVPFVVRPKTPTAGVKVLVQVPVTTMQAYNNYGGKSMYAYNSTGGVPATKVSFDRPNADPLSFAFDPWQAPLVRWLAKNGIAADFCTSVDLHQDSASLNGYKLFLTAGHDEYWSRNMRSRFDIFVGAGGNAAIFSGNTCWWQVRFEANSGGTANRTLVCYKSRSTDPDTREAYKTTNWISLVPPDPENSSIGLGWNLGAAWAGSLARPDTPYVVQRGEHWAFEGAGLLTGANFGGAYCGYEVDALDFRTGLDGRAYPTAADGTPATLRVLALADASTWDAKSLAMGGPGEKSGYAAISIHSRGGAAGAIFNGGTIDWVRALQPELDGQIATPFSRITRNVVTRLSAPYFESADVRKWHNVQVSGDGSRYFYTVGADAPAGAVLDGLAFRAYAAPIANTVPVYRYKATQANGDGDRYIYNLNANLGLGWTPDGIAFHAFASAVAGSAAIYQHHIVQANGDGWRLFYSPLMIEPGWTFDGVAFFVPTA
ncbi:MAG: hypothetical protein PHQ58_14815 [Rhodoferax sp.]|uniref:N,N-dimethylformamidase beta subunit family domain-containing protein n=1 Tax=Rhodoferax sp. TaxID=50421 RepID=UPI00263A2E24|nr:N,N-dimethylformamidase beta subunit family domain-containing protein [Rhodoferax sp.]MDD2881700.1 hypothetical protein [Rhodoferax sp.]